MWQILGKFFIPILICALSLASGVFIGNKIGRGESISIWKTKDGKTEVILGPTSILNVDLENLTNTESAGLFEKIASLSPNHYLAQKLINASDCDRYFFENPKMSFIVKFSQENNKISKSNGAACANSIPYKKRLNVYKINDDSLMPGVSNRMMELFINHSMPVSNCKSESESTTLWISEKAAAEWFGLPVSNLPQEINVEAEILATL